jgi:dTDP-4-dehydrorhamnose 3,5-epimerase
MNLIKTHFEEVVIIEPAVWPDSRGYFFESYNMERAVQNGLEYEWVQDNEAKSTKGVLRGLHYQLPPYAQTKLVRVVQGEVLDVIVDIRPGSRTFGQHLSIILSGSNFKQLLVPRGFAHGYVVLSDEAIFSYKCDNIYHKDSERGIAYDDPALGINWILPKENHIVSDKDMVLPGIDNHSTFI